MISSNSLPQIEVIISERAVETAESDDEELEMLSNQNSGDKKTL